MHDVYIKNALAANSTLSDTDSVFSEVVQIFRQELWLVLNLLVVIKPASRVRCYSI